MRTNKKVILIDDDSRNNYISCQVIHRLCKPATADISAFSLVENGLAHLNMEISKPESQIVLFLDISMPGQLSGWDVLNQLSALPEAMQDRIVVFILSSTDRTLEKAKAIGYRLVKQFIQKPMMTSMTWLKPEIVFNDVEVGQQLPVTNFLIGSC